MQQILDAILAGDTSSEEFADFELPESFRAATVRKEDVAMFEGLAAGTRTRASRCTWVRSPCPSSARVRRSSR